MSLSSSEVFEDHVYKLHFNEPWKCPEGIVATRNDEIKQADGKRINELRIKIPVWDIRDYFDKHILAQLAEDGNGLRTVCTGKQIRDRDGVDKMCELIDKHYDKTIGGMVGEVDTDMKSTEEAVATDMADPYLMTITKLYKFPPGVTCNNHYFNNDSDGNKPSDELTLKNSFKIGTYEMAKTKEGHVQHNFNGFLVLEMAIDHANAQGQNTKIKKKTEHDEAADQLAAMGLAPIG
jgi:hypothetical protein